AGTARTEVAVGTSSEVSMFVTTRAVAPRSGVVRFSPVVPPPAGLAASRGFGGAGRSAGAAGCGDAGAGSPDRSSAAASSERRDVPDVVLPDDAVPDAEVPAAVSDGAVPAGGADGVALDRAGAAWRGDVLAEVGAVAVGEGAAAGRVGGVVLVAEPFVPPLSELVEAEPPGV
ncbi:MAG: hypothetical protein ACRCZD_12530, partial [Phycicoccus sp.]